MKQLLEAFKTLKDLLEDPEQRSYLKIIITSLLLAGAGYLYTIAPEQHKKFFIISLGVLLAFFVFFMFSVFKVDRNSEKRSVKRTVNEEQTTLAERIYEELEVWYEKGAINAIDFGRFVVFLTRPLWLAGQTDVTIKMGERARIYLEGDVSSTAQQYLIPIFIDNLGWHLWDRYREQQVHDALMHIKEGIMLAEERGEWKWIYKGYRHLAGLYAATKEIETAERYLKEMKKVLHEHGQDPEEDAGVAIVKGRIYEAKSSLAQSRQERDEYLQRALQVYRKAHKIYLKKKDEERVAKMLAELIRVARQLDDEKLVNQFVSECRQRAKGSRPQARARCEKEFILFLKQRNKQDVMSERCEQTLKELREQNAAPSLVEEIEEACYNASNSATS